MLRSVHRYGSVVAIALALAACNDDEGDDAEVRVSAGEGGARVAVDPATAQLALDELSANVDTTITGFSTSNPAQPAAPAGGTGQAVAVRCLAGGDAMVGGYVNIVPVPVNVDVKVAIDYNACVTNTGTTIEGEIDFSQTVVAGAGQPLRVETIYTGDIVFTGAVSARCPVDLNVLVDEAGQAIQVEGTFCGQDASALNLQISPRWSGAAGR